MQPGKMIARAIGLVVLISFAIFFGSYTALAIERKVQIVYPPNHAKVLGPVKVCMEVEGLILEPAHKGVNEGKGHHHLLFDSLPIDLSQPLSKQEIHMGDGSTCRVLDLQPGRHILYTVFAYGNHIPYDPPISDKIIITVKDQ